MKHNLEALVILKTPSVELHGYAAYLERFLMGEWVERHINSPHVLKPCQQTRERHPASSNDFGYSHSFEQKGAIRQQLKVERRDRVELQPLANFLGSVMSPLLA